MRRKLMGIIPMLATAVVLSAPVLAQVPGQADHPRMRAALHELREARKELKDARDTWPPGYKDRALKAINDAIESLRLNLAVRDVDSFVGVERNPDYYQKYKSHPRVARSMRAPCRVASLPRREKESSKLRSSSPSPERSTPPSSLRTIS